MRNTSSMARPTGPSSHLDPGYQVPQRGHLIYFPVQKLKSAPQFLQLLFQTPTSIPPHVGLEPSKYPIQNNALYQTT